MPAKKPSVSLRQRANRFGVRLTFDNRFGGRTRRSTSAISNEIRRINKLKFGVKTTRRSPQTFEDLKRLENKRNEVLVNYAVADKADKLSERKEKLRMDWNRSMKAQGAYATAASKNLWQPKIVNGRKIWVR